MDDNPMPIGTRFYFEETPNVIHRITKSTHCKDPDRIVVDTVTTQDDKFTLVLLPDGTCEASHERFTVVKDMKANTLTVLDKRRHVVTIHRKWKINGVIVTTLLTEIKLTAQAESLINRALEDDSASDCDCWLVADGNEFGPVYYGTDYYAPRSV